MSIGTLFCQETAVYNIKSTALDLHFCRKAYGSQEGEHFTFFGETKTKYLMVHHQIDDFHQM